MKPKNTIVDVPAASMSANTTPETPALVPTDGQGRLIIERLGAAEIAEVYNTWAHRADAMDVTQLRKFIVDLSQSYVHTPESYTRAQALIASAAKTASDKLLPEDTDLQTQVGRLPVLQELSAVWANR